MPEPEEKQSLDLKLEFLPIVKEPFLYNPFIYAALPASGDQDANVVSQNLLNREVSFSELSSYMQQLHESHCELERNRSGRDFEVTLFSQMASYLKELKDFLNRASIPKLRVRDFFEFENSADKGLVILDNTKVSLNGICEYFARFPKEFIPLIRESTGGHLPQRFGRGGFFNHFVKELRTNKVEPPLDFDRLPYPNFLRAESQQISQPENPMSSD